MDKDYYEVDWYLNIRMILSTSYLDKMKTQISLRLLVGFEPVTSCVDQTSTEVYKFSIILGIPVKALANINIC